MVRNNPRQPGVFYSIAHKRRIEAQERRLWWDEQLHADLIYWFSLGMAFACLLATK